MKTFIGIALTIFALQASAQTADSRYFEIRTYHCHENKLPDLIKRFRDHTMKLFEKHGMDNVAYFVPTVPGNNSLVYILAYPSKSARDSSWKAFGSDPEWQRAAKKSEENGPIVAKVDQVFMTIAPELSTGVPSPENVKRVFELRTYTCPPGKLGDLRNRFKNHTRALFEKHGMTNITYWVTEEKDGGQPKLVYLLAHKSEAAGKASFDAFRADADWQAVAKKSEENGKIVENVESVYLEPLPYSPLK